MRKFMTIGIATVATVGALTVQAPAADAAEPGVTKVTSGSGQVLRVVMYADAGFKGDRLEYYGSGSCSSSTSDTADFSMSVMPAGWNDRVSSWKDYNGCDVQFYMDGGFHGRYTYYLNAGSTGRGFGSEWNDKVSSFRVS